MIDLDSYEEGGKEVCFGLFILFLQRKITYPDYTACTLALNSRAWMIPLKSRQFHLPLMLHLFKYGTPIEMCSRMEMCAAEFTESEQAEILKILQKLQS